MNLYSTKRLIVSIVLAFLFWLFRAQMAYWKCSGYLCKPLAQPCAQRFELITRCCICYTNTHLITDIITAIIIPLLVIYTLLTLIVYFKNK